MALNDFLNAVNNDAPATKSPDYATGLTLAFESNPDEEAKKQRLERATGIPSLLMDEPVRKQAELQQFVTSPEIQMLSSHAPKTAEWLATGENAKISHDDVKELSAIDTVISKFRNGVGSLAAVPWSTSQGLWSAPRIAGDLLQTVTKPLAEMTGLPDVGGKLAQYSAQQQKGAGETAKYLRGKREGAGVIESGIYSGIESLGQNLLMLPATIMSGSATPMLLGMSATQGGQSYGEARDAGHSVLASSLFGASQASIEYATEMIPALRFVDAMKGKTTLAKALKNVLGPDVLGEQVATLSQDLNEWAVMNPDKPFSAYLEERPSAAVQTFIATIIGTGGMVATAKGLEKVGSSVEKYQAAKEQSDFLIALGDSVKASKTFARLPSAVQELVKSIKQDGSVQDVYVPVEKFTELFQSQGMDARQAAEQILSDPKRYYEAVATGGDVAIPLEEFAMLSDAPFYGELAKDARTSISGMSQRDLEAFNSNQEQTVNDLLAELADETPNVDDVKYQDAYQRIYDDTYGSLIGVNQNPSEAQANATLRAKGLATLAQRYGYDADALMAQFPINVTRGDLPDSLKKQPSFSEQQQTAQLTAMLDTIRSGKEVAPSEMFGPSLGELLREKGVKDDRGDLAALELDKGIKFKKKMLRKDGMSLDKAREAAVEQGYLPEGATTEDLIDALANEMRGQAKYSPEYTNHVLIDQKQSHDELAQWLDMMGVDLAQTTNEAIIQQMQAAVSGDGMQLDQAAFHGSPHTFDKFTTSAIGTGEGAQAFGHGLYFTDSKEITEFYKDKLGNANASLEIDGKLYDGDKHYELSEIDQIIARGFHSLPKNYRTKAELVKELKSQAKGVFKEWKGRYKEAIAKAESGAVIFKHPGKMYKVEIAPTDDEMLHWDKPFTEQSKHVKEVLKSSGIFKDYNDNLSDFKSPSETRNPSKKRGDSIYEFLAWKLEKEESEKLRSERDALISKYNDAGNLIAARMQMTAEERKQEGEITAQLVSLMGIGAVKASKYLHSLGIRGIKYQADSIAKQGHKKAFNFVIFDDSDIVITEMWQKQKDIKRGYIKFGENMPGFEIALLKDADTSTFLHELGHYYHEVLGRLATSEGAPEQLKADYDTLLKWLSATDKQSLTVEQSEKFARGFEAYLYEGNAPSQELRGVFQRFKTWLKAVYASLKSLNVELSDDVRGVFDRLLATDEEIKTAEREQSTTNIFTSAKDAGMSESVFEAYRKLAEQAHENAKDRLEREKLKEITRTQKAWWKEAREKMLEDVEAEAKAEPVYEAIHFLHTGKLFDGSVFEGESFKLSGAELNKLYDAPTVKALRKKLGDVYRNEGGLSPRMVAEMFGFSSTDEMIKKMMESPKLKEFVQAETDRRMNEQYGMMNSADIAEEAINSVHTDEYAKLLREEMKAIRRKVKEVKPFVDAEKNAALDQVEAEREYERRWMDAERKLAVAIERGAKQAEIDDLKASIRADKERARSARKMAGSSIPPVEFFKEAARRHIDGLKVSEITPGKYGQAEAKAGREAFELNGKGRYAEAAEAKQRQLLNHFLYRMATEARNESEKISAYMRGLEAGKVQQRIGKAGQDYLEQVNALLDKYEFRRQTGAELEARESLLDWMDRYEKEKGYAPAVAPSVMEEARQVNYRSLTFGELVDVKDTVEAIVHLARAEGKLLRDELKRDIIEVAEEGAASIEHHSKGRKPRKPEKSLPQDLPGKYMENYFASHRKMSSLARQMDGGQDGGMIWNMLIRPMNEAGDKEAIMRAEAATKLNEIVRVYSALERTKMHHREFIPEINNSLSKWGRIMVALNMGNDGNRQRLASMYSAGEVTAIVDGLDQRDWQFVQNMWDMLESYWPQIEAKEKRVNGVAPQKVEHTPVVTKFGTLQGGYFPIKYDIEETAKSGAQDEAEIYKQMMGGAFTKATTRHGHTEARLEAVNRPLSLSIDTVFQHFNQIIHDLTHHEMLVDVNRLLGTTQLQEAIRDNYGMEAYRVFSDGVRDVAVGDIPAQDAFEKFMAYTRVGISTAGLGYNLVTSMMQPLGLTQSIVRIGPRWVGKGISRWVSSPKHMVETADWIYSKSDFMKMRGMTQNREIAEIRNQMTVGVIPFQVRDSFFYFIQQMQKVVDIPTWLGQYEKSMAAHGNEADAIAEADQAVIDSQASGQMKDLARIQKGGPLKKMFTTFYSFFSTTYNLAAESAGRTHFNNPAEVGRFMVDMLMLYSVPTVLTMALKEGVQRAIGGGDDDEEKLLKKLATEQLGYIMGGFVGLRELSSLFSGFNGYEGPTGSRFYSEMSKLAKEAGQGDFDAGLFKRLNSVGGILLHYPATQVQRVVDGMKEIHDGRGNLLSLLFGKPKKN